jgi:hypothetical protein
MGANILIPSIADPKIYSFSPDTKPPPPDGNYFSYFTLAIVTIILWIICWLATSNWPWGKALSWEKFKYVKPIACDVVSHRGGHL